MRDLRPSVLIAVLTVVVVAASVPAFADRLYWTVGFGDTVPGFTGNLVSVRTDGSDLFDILELPETVARSIAVDSSARQLYWVEHDLLANETSLVRGGQQGCGRLSIDNQAAWVALDAPAGKVYWSETPIVVGVDKGRIRRANLDLSSAETLLDSLSGPDQIGLDLQAGKIYWYDFADEALTRSDLDGSNLEVMFVSGNLGRFQVSGSEQKLYWTTQSPGGLQRTDYDGSNVEPLASQVTSAFVVDVGAAEVYWREDGGFGGPTAKIKRADLDGTNEVLVIENPFAAADSLVLSAAEPVITVACGPAVPALGSASAIVLLLTLLALGARRIKCRAP